MSRNILTSLLAIFSLSTIYFFLSFLGERREVQFLRTKNQTQTKMIDSLVSENFVKEAQLIRYEIAIENFIEKNPEQKNNIEEVLLNTE